MKNSEPKISQSKKNLSKPLTPQAQCHPRAQAETGTWLEESRGGMLFNRFKGPYKHQRIED